MLRPEAQALIDYLPPQIAMVAKERGTCSKPASPSFFVFLLRFAFMEQCGQGDTKPRDKDQNNDHLHGMSSPHQGKLDPSFFTNSLQAGEVAQQT
jgi:hypothetical protein